MLITFDLRLFIVLGIHENMDHIVQSLSIIIFSCKTHKSDSSLRSRMEESLAEI